MYVNLDPFHDLDEWTFPSGYYLAKKYTHGGLYYLHHLARYKIDGDWHNFNGFDDGGGRLEQIANPDVLDISDFASMYTAN